MTNGDLIFEYNRAILHRGIGEMVRHKAIRINDGQIMMIHWKDMLEFYELNHPKYFLCGTGFSWTRTGHQILWNRTVNVKGGQEQSGYRPTDGIL